MSFVGEKAGSQGDKLMVSSEAGLNHARGFRPRKLADNPDEEANIRFVIGVWMRRDNSLPNKKIELFFTV
ncbi:hypothetical protein [Leptospira interrogans]|uniref:hypothetical protein n=1 Tax=Leptospira interrogans TaxID=173 RepID=UPI00398FD6A9